MKRRRIGKTTIMRRLLLFTTIVALSTAYLRPSYDYARDREKPSHAHAINQFPYEDSYFDFARNLMGMSELRAKNRVPTAENQVFLFFANIKILKCL